MPIMNKNHQEYSELVLFHMFMDSVRVQFQEFKTGFLESVRTIVFDLFIPEGLALLVAEREEQSFMELENITRYERL
jgi:hypothetical protein